MRRRTWTIPAAAASAVAAIAVRDLAQRQHALLRNFPVIGHTRRALESIGPELRQYIVAGNNEERPFTRDQRRWVYASAKKQNNYFGFGTDNGTDNDNDNDNEYTAGYPIIKHRKFGPVVPPSYPLAAQEVTLPSAKVLGAARGRRKAFRPQSVVNISAMSFGSLSGPAIVALSRGAAVAGCLHNTGEGGLSRHHRHGGELVLQIGTGYFGCRDADGRFSLDRLKYVVASSPVRAGDQAEPRAPSRASAAFSPAPRSPRRSPRSAVFRRARIASVRRGMRSSPTPTVCWTGSRCSPTRPAYPSASRPPSAT